MAWLTTASSANQIIADRRKLVETYTYLLNPPVSLRRTTTTTTYHYVGIDAGAADSLVDAAILEAGVADAYFEYGDGGGGVLVVIKIDQTGWVTV
jgi:hypothetical protein